MSGSSLARAASGALAAAAAALAWAAARPGRTVALVTIDTLRADRVGAYGASAPLTPHLDRLARRATTFANARTVAPLTLPAHASMLTGAMPDAHGVRHNGFFRLGAGRRTLAEAMADRGHATAAFVSCSVLSRGYGLSRGFHVYDDVGDAAAAAGPKLRDAERPGGETLHAAGAWMARQPRERALFFWVHLFEPHAPYAPPSPFSSLGAYDGEVATADHHVAALAGMLRRYGRDAEMWVVSDHGEALGEHGEPTHGVFLYDATLRVPMLGPAGAAAGSIAPEPISVAALFDLVQGNPAVRGPVLAESLAPSVDFGWAGLRAVVDGDGKYVRAPREELYDLASDPGELRNLALADAAATARWRALLPEAAAPEAPALDEEERRRLESLGYLGGSSSGRHAARAAGADPKDMVDLLPFLADDTAELERSLDAFLARDPGNRIVRLRKAWLLLSRGDPAGARKLFLALAREGALGAAPLQGLAAVAGGAGDYEEALRHFAAAAVVDPGDLTIAYNRGQILAHLGRHAAAASELERAIPDPAVGPGAAALLFRIQRSGVRPLRWTLDGEVEPARLHAVAREALRLGAPDAAAVAQARAQAVEPLDAAGLVELSRRETNPATKIALLERAVGRDPHHAGARAELQRARATR